MNERTNEHDLPATRVRLLSYCSGQISVYCYFAHLLNVVDILQYAAALYLTEIYCVSKRVVLNFRNNFANLYRFH